MSGKFEGLNVLVVEDSLFLAELIGKNLQSLGCEVIGPAPGVDEAMALLEAGDTDGALLDINLGRGNTSFPVAEELLKKKIPFGFLTGYDDPSIIPPEYRAIPVLLKPFDIDQLALFILDLMASAVSKDKS